MVGSWPCKGGGVEGEACALRAQVPFTKGPRLSLARFEASLLQGSQNMKVPLIFKLSLLPVFSTLPPPKSCQLYCNSCT
eukprot:5298091-Amphidinium_carterae.1